jgi:hypothetical protein
MSENGRMQRTAAVTFVSWACLLLPAGAFAQSNDGFELARISLTSAREYVATEAIPRQLGVPSNLIIVTEEYRPLIESMLQYSPTFRRQCFRISGEPRVTVHLRVGSPSWLSGARARTNLTRDDVGHLSAVIEISPLQDNIELIAHEIEHVIEQLDGVDLAARAALPNTGVWAASLVPNVFETTRAKHIGLVVMNEFREGQR